MHEIDQNGLKLHTDATKSMKHIGTSDNMHCVKSGFDQLPARQSTHLRCTQGQAIQHYYYQGDAGDENDAKCSSLPRTALGRPTHSTRS